MIIIMSSYEGYTPETASYEEALEVIEGTAHEWKSRSKGLSAEVNTYWTYHFVRWLQDLYGSQALSDYSEEFDGTELPKQLQGLVAYEYKDEIHFARANTVRLEHKPRKDHVAAHIPEWDRLRKLPIAHTIETVINTSTILDNIRLAGTLLYDMLSISYRPDPVASRWGLQFVVAPSDLHAYVWGAEGSTQVPSHYVETAQKDFPGLASTVSELSILAVKHSARARRQIVSAEDLGLFEARLKGEEPIQFSAEQRRLVTPPGEKVKQYVIDELIDLGFILRQDVG